jgi:Spy/CpxP family protein refolding chaperone
MKSTRQVEFIVRSIAAACAAVLIMSVPAAAQGKWWQSEKFIKELGLTPEQTRQLENTFQASLPNLRALKKALDEAESEFERRWERGEEVPIMEQVNRVEAARAELNIARTKQLLRMRGLLTMSQWAKFTALHEDAERQKAASGTSAVSPPRADSK